MLAKPLSFNYHPDGCLYYYWFSPFLKVYPYHFQNLCLSEFIFTENVKGFLRNIYAFVLFVHLFLHSFLAFMLLLLYKEILGFNLKRRQYTDSELFRFLPRCYYGVNQESAPYLESPITRAPANLFLYICGVLGCVLWLLFSLTLVLTPFYWPWIF